MLCNVFRKMTIVGTFAFYLFLYNWRYTLNNASKVESKEVIFSMLENWEVPGCPKICAIFFPQHVTCMALQYTWVNEALWCCCFCIFFLFTYSFIKHYLYSIKNILQYTMDNILLYNIYSSVNHIFQCITHTLFNK